MTARESRAEPEGRDEGSKHRGEQSDAVGAAEPVAKPAASSPGTQCDQSFYFRPSFLMGSETHVLTRSSMSVASPRGARDTRSP